MLSDRRGLAVTTASPAAIDRLDRAVASFAAHRADAAELVAAARTEDPGLAAAHCLEGFLLLLLARAELQPTAARALANARAALADRGGTAREHGLERALARWCAGDMEGAADRLDQVLEAAPLDLMAGKLAHALRFMLGDAAGMRRSALFLLGRWPADAPDRGFVRGWHAFALGETGETAAAEAEGRGAVEEAPDDVWGCHAVAHVYEAQGRPAAGLAWLAENAGRWGEVNNFRRHLHWHAALCHLRRGDHAAALLIYDHWIRDVPTDDYRDVANAVSLLRRLAAAGVDLGGRWAELAVLAEARIEDQTLIFAALHRLMALVGAGRLPAAARQLAAMERHAVSDTGSQARVLREIGIAMARRILGLAPDDERSDDELRTLLPRLGGSVVQRQIFESLLDPAPAPRRAADAPF